MHAYDPETQVVVPLEGDLGQIMMACATGSLQPNMVKWKDSSCCLCHSRFKKAIQKPRLKAMSSR